MLGCPRNNFTYLDPSDIGIWAHHAKQAQSGKTSGFEKPVTGKGNPRNRSSWGNREIFSGNLFSQQPNAIYLQPGVLNEAKNLGLTQENDAIKPKRHISMVRTIQSKRNDRNGSRFKL